MALVLICLARSAGQKIGDYLISSLYRPLTVSEGGVALVVVDVSGADGGDLGTGKWFYPLVPPASSYHDGLAVAPQRVLEKHCEGRVPVGHPDLCRE